MKHLLLSSGFTESTCKVPVIINYNGTRAVTWDDAPIYFKETTRHKILFKEYAGKVEILILKLTNTSQKLLYKTELSLTAWEPEDILDMARDYYNRAIRKELVTNTQKQPKGKLMRMHYTSHSEDGKGIFQAYKPAYYQEKFKDQKKPYYNEIIPRDQLLWSASEPEALYRRAGWPDSRKECEILVAKAGFDPVDYVWLGGN